MNMKKILATAMCAAIITGAFSSCAAKQQTPSSTKQGNTESNPSSVSAPSLTEEEYELVIAIPESAQDGEKEVEAKLNELFKDKINCTVDLQVIPVEEYKAQMERKFLGNEKVDLAFASAADGYSDNVSKGAYTELDELLNNYGKDILSAVHEFAIDGVKVNGKIYGVPTNKEIDNGVAYVFNKELVDKYSFDVKSVKTLKDIEPMLEVIKKSEKDTVPAYNFKGNGLIEGDVPGWQTIMNYAGYVKLDDGEMKVQNVLSEQYGAVEKEMYTIMRDWFNKGYVNADAETAQVGPWKAWGNKTMWVKKDINKPYRERELETLFGQPVVAVTIQDTIVKNTQGAMMTIPRTSKNPERAMMALNLIYSDAEIYNTLIYGIEGVHYTVVKESPKTIKRVADSGYSYDIAWRIGNQFNSYLLEGEPEDKWTKFAEYNSQVKKSPILGFSFNPSKVVNEIAQINNIYSEYWRALCAGTRDVESTLKERNEKLASAGIDKVTAEIQAQLDAWKAAN